MSNTKEPQPVTITEYRGRKITEWSDGKVSFNGLYQDSYEAAKAKIDLIENNLMIGRIK
jgi:hypothetical protein